MRVRQFMFGGFVWGMLVLASSTQATTWYVPDDFGTIQAALDAAGIGDEIVVRDGTWTGDGNRNLDFGGKDLVLRSQNGPDACILNAEGNASVNQRVFNFQGNETREAVVDGFTITGGYATWEFQIGSTGGGINCKNGSSPTIQNCIIENNQANGGAGIYVSGSNPYIQTCIIRNNVVVTANGLAGGVYLGGSNGTVNDCEIRSNSAGSGAGIALSLGTPLVYNCRVIANIATNNGGGIFISSSGSAIRFSTISGNEAAQGGGIFCSSSSEIYKCTISGNLASDNGPDTGRGGGILCFGVGSNDITYTLLANNTCDQAGGGSQVALVEDTAHPSVVMEHCLMVGGPADAYDPGGTLVWDASCYDADPQFCALDPDAEEWWALQDDSPAWLHGWGVIGAWSAECGPSATYLEEFSVHTGDRRVHLTWKLHYGADGVEFRLVGRDGDTTWPVAIEPISETSFEAWDSSPAIFKGGDLVYDLSVRDRDQGWLHLASRQVSVPVMTGKLRIVGAHPNPFNPAVTVEFYSPRALPVSLTVHDLSGRHIASLSHDIYPAGPHTVAWDGRDDAGNTVAAGVYLVHLESEEGVQSLKIMLVK